MLLDIAAGEAKSTSPVLLAEFEADRATELDQLLIAEQLMEARPQLVVGAIGVPGDCVRPVERGALASVEAREIGERGIAREVAEAELLQPRVDEAAAKDVVARVGECVLRGRNARSDLVGGAREVGQLDLLPFGGEARVRVGEEVAVPDAPGLDHALLSVGQLDELAELDDLIVAEMLAEAFPDDVVGAFGVPDEHAGVEQCSFLPLAVPVGALEVEEIAVVLLLDALLSGPERPLRSSVVAVDRLRDVDTAEFLERVLDGAAAEDRLPRTRERLGDCGDVRADRLRLRTRCSEQPRLLEVLDELRIRERRGIDVREPRHRAQASG